LPPSENFLFYAMSLSLLQTVQNENCKPQSSFTQHKNAVDHKNENPVAGVGRMNFPGPNKSVTAEVKKVKIELAASL